MLLAFDLDSVLFQYRVGALVLRDDHLLVARADGADFCFLPGGRVEAGESAAEALRREMREELETDVEVGRLLWVVENFFPSSGKRCHELCLLFAATLRDQRLDLSLAHHDPADGITIRWLPIDAVHAAGLQPSFLRDALHAPPASPAHIVVRDA